MNHKIKRRCLMALVVALEVLPATTAIAEITGSCPTTIRSARVDMHFDVVDWLRGILAGSGSVIIEDAQSLGYQPSDQVCVYHHATEELIMCSGATSAPAAGSYQLHKSTSRGYDQATDMAINIAGFGSGQYDGGW